MNPSMSPSVTTRVHCAFCSHRAATFAGPDVDMGTVPSIVSAIIELLSGGTEVAVAFGKIRETLGTVERAFFLWILSRVPGFRANLVNPCKSVHTENGFTRR